MKLSPDILIAALEGLQAQRDRIVSQIADIRRVIGSGGAPSKRAVMDDWESPLAMAAPAARRKRPRLSAAARKRISEAQKKRWAATKGRKSKA
jgi:hypothetical protein